jgi:hypothetical protein
MIYSINQNQVKMKRAFLVLVTFFLIVNYSCEEKIDIEKEKEAIKAVIEEESASYYASNFERWSATHLQDSTAIRISASKSGTGFSSGWETISSNMKQTILNKRELVKEVKNFHRIKIYGESAWAVYDNVYLNNKGESTGKQLVTNFFEKHDGTWKIVLRDVITVTGYYQADNFIINSINYAKSLGKNVEDIASFTGDQFKTSWNRANGYNGFATGMLSNWRLVVPTGELKILEQDDNHIVFSANKLFPNLINGPQFNVTYEDYLTFYRVVSEKVAEYMGAVYKQETTPEGVLITINKK